mgnify:CR=1 FL=1
MIALDERRKKYHPAARSTITASAAPAMSDHRREPAAAFDAEGTASEGAAVGTGPDGGAGGGGDLLHQLAGLVDGGHHLVQQFTQNAQVLEEIVLIPVLGVDLKDADHAVIPVFHQLVELRRVRVLDHTVGSILRQYLVRAFANHVKTTDCLIFLKF